MGLHPLLGFKYVWNVMIGHSSSGGQTNGNGGETKMRFRLARLCCRAVVVYLRPSSLLPKCVPPPHGRFDGHGHEPPEAPELSFRL